jgi:hypothetical protein
MIEIDGKIVHATSSSVFVHGVGNQLAGKFPFAKAPLCFWLGAGWFNFTGAFW